jgi:hypothetical protein
MILKPYKRGPYDKPIGYVVDPETVIGEWSGSRWKDVPRTAVLYCNEARTMRSLYDRGECEAIYWKKSARLRKLSAWKWEHPDGHSHTVYFLKYALSATPEPERFPTICEYVNWIRFQGGAPGSLVGMLNSLQRLTMHKPFIESSYEAPGRELWRGSRVQEGKTWKMRKEFGPTDLWDMRSAFPSALTNLAIPRRWRRYASNPMEDIPDADSGFMRAIVRVPWMMHGPLPDVGTLHPTAIFPTENFLEGIWSFDELRVARDVGCVVMPYEYWTGNSFRHPFQPWGALVEELRSAMSPPARRLVKAAANQYVGRFAMSGHRERSRMIRGREVWTVEAGTKHPDSLTVHGLVTSHVRSVLFRDGIHPYPLHFIFCHTDGVALMADEVLDTRHPPTPEWRVKAYMERLLLLNPSRYAYMPGAEDPDPDIWKWVVAGVPELIAEPFFQKRWLKYLDNRADAILNGQPTRKG